MSDAAWARFGQVRAAREPGRLFRGLRAGRMNPP